MIDRDDEEDDERSYDDRVGSDDLDDGPSACIGADCCNPHVYHRRDECYTAEMAEAYAAELEAADPVPTDDNYGPDGSGGW